MTVKNVMTAEFLMSAYGGESMAYMRYLIWGKDAEQQSMPNIARLFRAISYAEQAHASNHFKELDKHQGGSAVAAGAIFGMGTVVENLQGAINGEVHEIEQMQPVYLQTAKFQAEKGAEQSFHYALEAEKIHATMFRVAQEAAKQNEDMKLGEVFTCPTCGFTGEGTLPDYCPICGANKKVFKFFPASS